MAQLWWRQHLTRRAVAQGYVAMLVDSLGPRGVDSVCMGPKGGVHFFVGVKDAYQAADWSRFEKLPLFRVANRMNAYNTYLLMEREAK